MGSQRVGHNLATEQPLNKWTLRLFIYYYSVCYNSFLLLFILLFTLLQIWLMGASSSWQLCLYFFYFYKSLSNLVHFLSVSHNKMFQVHFVLSLPWTWNEPLLQGDLVPFSEEQHGRHGDVPSRSPCKKGLNALLWGVPSSGHFLLSAPSGSASAAKPLQLYAHASWGSLYPRTFCVDGSLSLMVNYFKEFTCDEEFWLPGRPLTLCRHSPSISLLTNVYLSCA